MAREPSVWDLKCTHLLNAYQQVKRGLPLTRLSWILVYVLLITKQAYPAYAICKQKFST